MSNRIASKYRPSMYRWQVIDAYNNATRNLASCLMWAAALCAAWTDGVDCSGWDGIDWHPGCGREVPR